MNISNTFLKSSRFWGIDRAIAYTVFGRGASILAGPITAVLIASVLSPSEQGFYYTFNAVLAVQIFFELGLSLVILQFASHEKAKLEWTQYRTLEGDSSAKARLSSLLRMSLKWYGVIAVLVVAVILPAGMAFLNRHQSDSSPVSWQLPWIWLVVASAGFLFVSPLFSILEGCGLVAEVALVRALQDLVANLFLWLALLLGLKLLAASVFLTLRLLAGVGWLVLRRRSFFRDLISFRDFSMTIGWWSEIWPFQWKVALGYIAGYFIFHLFTPILFAFHGSIIAGQMGMSIAITNAIAITALAWVNTKAAPFGSLVAKQEFKKLDQMFFRSLWQSMTLIIFGMATFWGIVLFLNYIHHPLAQRLLPPLPLGLLTVATIIIQIVGAEAVYLRAHKQEPLLVISVLSGCLVGLSTYLLGKTFGATGMLAGYFAISLVVGLGGGTLIFMQKRRSWHSIALKEQTNAADQTRPS